MRRRKKLIIAILLVILIGLIAVIAGELFLPCLLYTSWLATVIAAAAAAVELAIAGTFPLTLGIYSMVLYHMFIGIIEAVLTVIVIMALEKYRPDLLMWNKQTQGGK